MKLSTSLGLLGILPSVLATGYLSTTSRWIIDENGDRVKLRCINWAGHAETNTPEGLNKQPLDFIAKFVADQGFNCVRLTYSIDMALAPDVTVEDSFSEAATNSGLSQDTLSAMYDQVLEQNSWIDGMSRRDVFGQVIAALNSNGVMTILDNHVSRAQWCCNLTDGNGWWDEAFGYNSENSRYFNTGNWLDGLEAMATWAKDQDGVVGMSLRNELRGFLLQDTNDHADWYNFVTQGAETVHAAFPDSLIIIGGSASATDLSFIRLEGTLDFSGWAGKHVWEMHAYSFTVTFYNLFGSCSYVQDLYGLFDGFVLTQNEDYTAPLFVSEFGVGMTGGPNDGLSDDDSDYFSCLKEYLQGNDADWSLWALQGTYYVREGVAEYDEGWGLMNSDWSGLRNSDFMTMLEPMMSVTQGPGI